MPLYEYECQSCANRFERIQKFSDPPVDTCPSCGGQVKKLVSSPAIQFKGSGWYITDYARKDSGTKSGETKPADKSDTAAVTSPASPTTTGDKPAAAPAAAKPPSAKD